MKKSAPSHIAISGGIVLFLVILVGCGGGGGGSDTGGNTTPAAPVVSFPDTLSDTFVFNAGVVPVQEVLGNVQIVEAMTTMDVDALWVESALVDGDVQAEKSSGRLRVNDSQVGGNVQFVENMTGPYTIEDNFIDGDLQFFKNQGPGTITGNIVEGNLQSKENDPRPTIDNNIVKGDLEDA